MHQRTRPSPALLRRAVDFYKPLDRPSVLPIATKPDVTAPPLDLGDKPVERKDDSISQT